MVSRDRNFAGSSRHGMRDRRRERYICHGHGPRMDVAAKRHLRFGPSVSHSQLAGLSAGAAQRTVPGPGRISAHPLSACRCSRSHPAYCFSAHCRRSFRAIGAGVLQFPTWGWTALSGVVSLALGIMLLAQMPVSSFWFVGFAIGVDLIFDGASLISFSTSLHGATKVTLEGIA